MQIFNFFEKRPTALLRIWFIQWQQFCIREQSATYAGEDVRNIGLSVDHYGLNKFGSRSDSYETISRSSSKHVKGGVPHAVVLYGLGGTGKSQMALGYAERQKHRYNPVFWLDAANEESMRSSFKRCATELQVQVERVRNQGSVFKDPVVQAVYIGVTLQTEAATLLLSHLKLDSDSASKEIQHYCNEVVQKLGCLALAIDLAGAHIRIKAIKAAPQFGAQIGPEWGGADIDMLHELSRFLSTKDGEWDSFHYRKGRDVLLRYNLLQRMEGNEKMEWPGVTMHNPVRWRAKQDDKG
ncbi:hypothetical protein CSUB01_10064 [Colletotrichum sublineola]|uniref:Uncharacterized protein n=1 Tax=Colletotrichum sublineola TaxID=1173701 RepID=A0A066XG48_COLSU|nr:hypothetical protein CSUB01_10064 [Colletotrichum sublineola]